MLRRRVGERTLQEGVGIGVEKRVGIGVGVVVDSLVFFAEDGRHGLESLLLFGKASDGVTIFSVVGDGAQSFLQDAVQVRLGVVHYYEFEYLLNQL